MSTSSNYTLALSVNESAKETFELLQVSGDGEELSGDMIGDFKKKSNLLLKEWQSQGSHLWTETEGTLFLTVDQAKYDFRDTTTKVTNEWFETTTTAAVTANTKTFTVTSADDIQADDTIGIIQNDNNLFWTTVARVSGLTVWVDDFIPLACLSGAYVRNYRDTFIPVSRVSNVRRQEGSDYEIPIVFQSREDYFNLPNKSQSGTSIQAYYDRQDVAGEKYGVMYLWNAPSSSVPVINFTYDRKMQILTDADETIDLPEYAQEAFIFNVAKKLLFKYGASPERATLIREEALRLRNDMLSYDTDSYPSKVVMRLHA